MSARKIRRWGSSAASLGAVLMAGALAASCTSAPSNTGSNGSPNPSQSVSSAPVKPVSLATNPPSGATGVAPGEPVTVSATDGKVSEVKLTNPDGTSVEGSSKSDGSDWESSQGLGYGKTYTLTATGQGSDGKSVSTTSTFTTVAKPARQTSVSLNFEEGETVGVGMPLIFSFANKITDKAAAEKALKVTSEPETEGAFHWFSDSSVTWRPKEYWKSGTKVSVNAAIYGKNLGNNTFGKEDRKASITIGDKLIAVADGQNHLLTVSVNDQEVKTVPTSMGKPGHNTPAGSYTVMSEHNGYTMDSSTYGVPADSPGGYRTFIKYAVRLSNSGIFYHSAPWSVSSQGKRNVSHGCLNLSTDNAKWLMDLSKKGDIVTVRNSGGSALSPTDGWSVWQMSWDDWKAGGR